MTGNAKPARPKMPKPTKEWRLRGVIARNAQFARWAIKASYFVGGVSALGAFFGFWAAVLGDAYADPLAKPQFVNRHGWGPFLHWLAIALAAYLILYLLIGGFFARRAGRAMVQLEILEPGASGLPVVQLPPQH